MSDFFNNALKSNAWPFLEAQKILENFGGQAPKKGYILFETGYGPSGLPHIGTFAEVARTTMVREAFKKISDIPTRLICFSDDLDGMRKVPANLPNQEMLHQYLCLPLTSVPDPFGLFPSFGHYMNNKLKSFLDRLVLEYEFLSSSECYQSGMFDSMLIKVAEKYDDIMELMLQHLERKEEQLIAPSCQFCPKTGKVLQVPIETVNVATRTVTYKDDDEEFAEVSIVKGGCKLQWKPDFGMRWAALEVDYEMYGKDHMPNAAIYSRICEILGKSAPVQFFYELFLDSGGAKISNQKGNSITVDEWLHYAPLESIALFMYQSPSKAKRLHFDVIPKCTDEYLTFNKKYHSEVDQVKQLASPAYHIHHGNVPVIETYGLSFALLLNLASVCNPENKSVLWGFITKQFLQSSPSSSPYLDHLVDLLLIIIMILLKQIKLTLAPSPFQQNILQEISIVLENLPEDATAEFIQTKLYEIGTKSGYENLRDYFKELYQILLGQTEGPRLGSFIKLFGIKDTLKLIQEVLQHK